MRYRKLWERSHMGESVSDIELDAARSAEETISTLTRNEFKSADRRLVMDAEDECYEFFGTRPS